MCHMANAAGCGKGAVGVDCMQTQRRNPRPMGQAGGETEASDEKDRAGELGGDPIVRELRKMYDGIIDEPVPDQLVDLLRKLDEVERKRCTNPSARS